MALFSINKADGLLSINDACNKADGFILHQICFSNYHKMFKISIYHMIILKAITITKLIEAYDALNQHMHISSGNILWIKNKI